MRPRSICERYLVPFFKDYLNHNTVAACICLSTKQVLAVAHMELQWLRRQVDLKGKSNGLWSSRKPWMWVNTMLDGYIFSGLDRLKE